MSFAVSNKLPDIEYSGKTFFTLFANLKNAQKSKKSVILPLPSSPHCAPTMAVIFD